MSDSTPAPVAPAFPKLDETNYISWAEHMQDFLMSRGYWRLTIGERSQPDATKDPAGSEKWLDDRDKAAGDISRHVSDALKVHIQGDKLRRDPKAMWDALQALFVQQMPGPRFAAYDALFSIRLLEGESLPSLVTRVESAMAQIKSLTDDKMDLEKLYSELAGMAMLRALPDEQQSLKDVLLLSKDLDKAAIISAFQTKQNELLLRTQTAMVAHSHSPAPSSSSTPDCSFCGLPGHSQDACYRYQAAQKDAKEQAKNRKKKKKNAQSAHAADAPDSASSAVVTEFAGNASLLDSPLQSDACAAWLPDTGATSHMTPHRHWFHTYTPMCVPIRLADNTIIYSAGVGATRFEPVLDGKSCDACMFLNFVTTSSQFCT